MRKKIIAQKIGNAKEEFHWLVKFENEVSNAARDAWYLQLSKRLKECNLELPEDLQQYQLLSVGYRCWEISRVLFKFAAWSVKDYNDKTRLRAELAEVESQLHDFKKLVDQWGVA